MYFSFFSFFRKLLEIRNKNWYTKKLIRYLIHCILYKVLFSKRTSHFTVSSERK